MPIHDWTRVNAGLFHHFHQRWIGALCDTLNAGGLPGGYFALTEQVAGGLIPDVLTLQLKGRSAPPSGTNGGARVGTAAPRARFVHRAEVELYLTKVNRVTIRHPLG